MKPFKKKIAGVFAFAAVLGTGTGVAHASEPVNQNEISVESPTSETAKDFKQASIDLNRQSMVAHYDTITDRNHYNPTPPSRLGDYERNLKLPKCERPDGAIYQKMEDVIRYMRHPHLTPRITSPDMTEAQIKQAQRDLITLGFDIDDDGLHGPATTRAVMEFQMFWGPISNTMDINGVIDNNVMDHLEYYAAVARRDARTYNISDTSVVAAIRMATLLKNDDFELWMEMSFRESTHRTDAAPPKGTARGLFQHIERTYDKNVIIAGCNYGMGQYAKNYRISYDGQEDAEIIYTGSSRDHRFLYNTRYNPRFSAVMAVENNQFEIGLVEGWLGQSLRENYQRYSIHFKGVDAGYFFWKGYYNTPNAIAAHTFPKQARYNRNIYYDGRSARTYAQVANWFDDHFGTGKYREQYMVAVYAPPANTSNVRYAGQVEQSADQKPAEPSTPEQADTSPETGTVKTPPPPKPGV